MTGITWLPGKGWAVAARGFVAWLPGAPDEALATELFDLQGPGTFSAACELLSRRAPAYALLQTEGPVALESRGGVRVRCWDRAGAPLASDLASAIGVTLGDPGSGTGGLPIAVGVVTCGSVTWGTAAGAVSVPKASAPAQPPEQSSAPATEVPPGPDQVVVTGSFIAEVPEWVAQAQPNPFAELWGHTMRRPVEAAAVRVVRNSDGEPEAPDVEPVAERPAATASPPEPAVEPAPAAVGAPLPPRSTQLEAATLIGDILEPERIGAERDHGEVVASDGRRLPIVSTVVLGRAPHTIPDLDCQLLRLASPERSISRNHALISLIDGIVRGKDLGSNNGTVLVRRGQRIALGTDTWTPLRSGDVLDFGEDVIVHLVGLP